MNTTIKAYLKGKYSKKRKIITTDNQKCHRISAYLLILSKSKLVENMNLTLNIEIIPKVPAGFIGCSKGWVWVAFNESDREYEVQYISRNFGIIITHSEHQWN